MKQRFFLSLMLLLFSVEATARENPFAPADSGWHEPLTAPAPVPDFEERLIPIIRAATCEAAKPPAPKPVPVKAWSPPQKMEQGKQPAIVTHTPLPQPVRKAVKKKKKRHRAPFRTIYHDDNLQIMVKGASIKILTGDRLMKHFQLFSPQRLVLDFGDDFVIYPSIDKKVHTPYLKALKIGTHPCFYRVTFVLKKGKRYRVRRLRNGYLITLF